MILWLFGVFLSAAKAWSNLVQECDTNEHFGASQLWGCFWLYFYFFTAKAQIQLHPAARVAEQKSTGTEMGEYEIPCDHKCLWTLNYLNFDLVTIVGRDGSYIPLFRTVVTLVTEQMVVKVLALMVLYPRWSCRDLVLVSVLFNIVINSLYSNTNELLIKFADDTTLETTIQHPSKQNEIEI